MGEVGERLGEVEKSEGCMEGDTEGKRLIMEGTKEGRRVGDLEGVRDGSRVVEDGAKVYPSIVGDLDGLGVGAILGIQVGEVVISVGEWVGSHVSASPRQILDDTISSLEDILSMPKSSKVKILSSIALGFSNKHLKCSLAITAGFIKIIIKSIR